MTVKGIAAFPFEIVEAIPLPLAERRKGPRPLR
jgi:hypothetical protein